MTSTGKPPPFQFSLRSLLAVMFGCSLALSLFTSLGFILAVMLGMLLLVSVCLALDVRAADPAHRKTLGCIAIGVILILVAPMVLVLATILFEM